MTWTLSQHTQCSGLVTTLFRWHSLVYFKWTGNHSTYKIFRLTMVDEEFKLHWFQILYIIKILEAAELLNNTNSWVLPTHVILPPRIPWGYLFLSLPILVIPMILQEGKCSCGFHGLCGCHDEEEPFSKYVFSLVVQFLNIILNKRIFISNFMRFTKVDLL